LRSSTISTFSLANVAVGSVARFASADVAAGFFAAAGADDEPFDGAAAPGNGVAGPAADAVDDAGGGGAADSGAEGIVLAPRGGGRSLADPAGRRCANVPLRMPVLLTEQDVRAVLGMDDLIAAMERALERFSAGAARQPLRTVVEAGGRGVYGVMPAFLEDPPALGTKLVSVYHGNAAKALPSHLATIVLHDPETGGLLAVMDGRYITEARTAAASAASAKHLARKDARVLAILGSGVQARSHAEALTRVRAFDEIRVWGRTPERAAALAADLAPHIRTRIAAVPSAHHAVDGADVVALTTASREPVLQRRWLRDGVHLCAVGACRPDQRELDTATVKDARVFVDSREGALAEAGDLIIPMREGAIDASHIVAELGDVFGGRAAGRRDDAEITLFKSLGMAVEDVAAARLAFERASERGLGRGAVI
jgi:ornithine cyclodeaminase